ncbi:hypothetical protein MMC11_004615 [Xylographa trunciseda]|nr:hypothetical protein [Xylographa trunciseda]
MTEIETEIEEILRTAVTDAKTATEQVDTTIVAEGFHGHGQGSGGGKGAGRGTMKETGRDIKRVAAVDETEETEVCKGAGVEAEAEAETDEKPAPPRSDRQRTRSRSPARNGASSHPRIRSPPRKPTAEVIKPPITKPVKPLPTTAPVVDKMEVDPPAADPVAPAKSKPKSKAKAKAAPEEDSDPEVAQMRALMGFAGFKTTKDTKVPGNNVYAVRKEKKTEYRQYMNRVGGFNRPLSPSR